VRCGRCSRVFDASENLIEEPAAAREAGVAQAQSTADAAAAPATALYGTPRQEQAQAPAAPGRAAAAPAVTAAAVAAAAIAEAEAAAPAAVDPEAGASELVAQGTGTAPDDAEAEAASAANAYGFGPIAAGDTPKRGLRWPWLLGALLLLMALLAQAAYYYRSALIVLFPQAKPYAAELCAKLGCDLPLPRRIELMSIEASDLQADTANPGIMVLSATLKNRAVFNQQLPMLELTLTDAQDQPVVRRVLAPPDYASKAADAQSGFAANTEIAIKVFIEASQVKAVGYRLYLFYP
jgi:hypothetical protein